MIVLPKRIAEKLRRESEKAGVSEEELVVEALSRMFDEPLDPEARFEVHLKLSEKYLRDAEEFLARGDYVQASGKAWGAAAQIVKAVVAKEGREFRGHAELWGYMDELAERAGNVMLRYLWRTANALYQNFYEGWMPPREVELAVKDVKVFVEKLRATVQR
uniref:HEPN domain-containing protein n=1 Tax=Thermofilum adornatum TaxID=1365176 RepID=A0A7C1GR78_9CREN